jgi:RNA binding exosome subunit
MIKKSLIAVLSISIFSAGVFFGKRFQKKQAYAGILNLYPEEDSIQLYVSLEIPLEKLSDLTDVVFKINKIRRPSN